MEISPTKEEIKAAKFIAAGKVDDHITNLWAKEISKELKRIAQQWEKLSNDAQAMVEVQLDRKGDFGDGWPDIGRAIRGALEEWGSPDRHRPPNNAGLREAVESLWKAYRARVPDAGMGKLTEGAPPYPALRFVAAGVKAIWPERYEGKDNLLWTEVDSQLRAVAYPKKPKQ